MKQLLILLVLLASCTPIRYVYVDPKDSVVKRQRVIHDNVFIPTPLYYNSWFWYNRTPYYRPIVVQPRRPIVVPQRVQPRQFPSRPPKWKN